MRKAMLDFVLRRDGVGSGGWFVPFCLFASKARTKPKPKPKKKNPLEDRAMDRTTKKQSKHRHPIW